MTCNYKFRWI